MEAVAKWPKQLAKELAVERAILPHIVPDSQGPSAVTFR
jgi:hypothetical protein